MELTISTKRMTLCSQSKNSQGFHVRVEGVDLDSLYKRNPLLVYDHDYSKALGNGQDVTLKDGKISYTPAFNTHKEFANEVYSDVETGTIRMSSAGLVPKLWGKDEAGEIWLEESVLKEITIVPFGADPDALSEVALYDENDQMIRLSADYFNEQIPTQKSIDNMKKIELSAETLGLIMLSEKSSEADVAAKVAETIQLAQTQAQEIVKLKENLATAKDDKTKAEDDLKKLKATTEKENIVQLKTMAVDTEKRLSAEAFEELIKLGYDGAKAVIEKMPVNQSIEAQLKAPEKDTTRLVELSKKSYQELFDEDKLVELKELSEPVYLQKMRGEFGKDWTPEDK